MTNLENYINDLNKTENSLPGTDLPWLTDLRTQAEKYVTENGFPTRKTEEWKYTSLNTLTKQPFTFSSQQDELSFDVSKHLLTKNYIIFIDGYYHFSNFDAVPKNVTITSLAKQLKENPEKISSYFNQSVKQNAFTALNTASMTDGLYLEIPDRAVIDEAIQVIYVGQTEQLANNIRNLIIAGKNSQASIIEHYIGATNEAYFTNTITEISLEANANITHTKFIQEGDQAFHIGALHASLTNDSHLTSHSIALTGSLVRSDSTIDLIGAGAQCDLYGLYMPKDKQHIDHHTVVNHMHPETNSREVYKGILRDKATGVFNGKIYVAPDAQKTSAELSNKNLLLSPHATMNTKHELHIFANDET